MKMHYGRQIPNQSRAADNILEIISTYPEGVTVDDMVKSHKVDLSSALAAIDLLFHEGKLSSDEPWREGRYLYQKLYACL
jgi:hypothetical protein